MKNYVLTCVVMSSMTSMFLGYNLGATSEATIFTKELNISHTKIEVATVTLDILSLLGLLMVGQTTDRISRRHSIVSAGAFFFLGRLLMGVTRNYILLLLGRLLANIGVSYALTITPVYIAEMSPAFSRGKFTSFPEVFFNAGTILGYISSYVFPKVKLELGWRVMLNLGAFSSYLLTIGVLAMPESPRWLIMQGRVGDANDVLDMISDSNAEAALRLDEIKKAADTQQSTGSSGWRDLLHPTHPIRHMLICAIWMHLFRQASVINFILDGPEIFGKVSITDSNLKLLATIIIDLTKMMGMLVPTF